MSIAALRYGRRVACRFDFYLDAILLQHDAGRRLEVAASLDELRWLPQAGALAVLLNADQMIELQQVAFDGAVGALCQREQGVE